MPGITSPYDLFAMQVPQVLTLVYLVTIGSILPIAIYGRRTVRDGLRLSRLPGLVALALLMAFVATATGLLVFLVVLVLPGTLSKVVFASTVLVFVGGAVVAAWPVRARMLRWVRASEATRTISDIRLQILADRYAVYFSGHYGVLLIFVVTVIGAAGPVLSRPGRISNARAVELFIVVLGVSVVALGALEVLRRIFPDANLLGAYRHGTRTTGLVDLCDRCFSREISRAPEALRTPYTHSAERTLASMAKALHRGETDTAAVRKAVHDAVEPSLSLGGQEVVHRLGSGTPSLRADLTRVGSVLAGLAAVLGSIKVFVDLVAPVLG